MRNISLIGMPGVGKSTIGVILAKVLGMRFIDTDLLIQNSVNRLLQDIIDTDGIRKFLDIEERSVLSLRCESTVIATGGSVIYSKKAIEFLKKSSIVVHLKLGYDEIAERISNITTRGIVMEKSQSLFDIYNERVLLYQRISDIIIDCSRKSVEDVIRDIVEKLKDTDV